MLLSVAQWMTILLVVLSSEGGLNAESYNEVCDLDLLRLPDTFTPNHYDIQIWPNLYTMVFFGRVRIEVTFNGLDQCLTDRCSRAHRVGKFFGNAARNVFGSSCGGGVQEVCDKRIVLHAGKLIKLDKLRVYKKTKGDPTEKDNLVKSVCMDRQEDMLAISLNSRASRGQSYVIDIEYYSKIGKESRGFYQSEITDTTNNNTHYLDANTHFFPADARSALPCFDEPHLKASFELSIIHHTGLHAISNTRVVSHTPFDNQQGGREKVRFARTPPMSTYNFAFAVGHYEPLVCPSDKRVVAYAPLGRSQEAQFVLRTVCDAIPVVQDYFGASTNVRFPLEKLDLVVTSRMRDPSRENWGMLVITENFLLTDADTTNVLRVEIAKLAVHIVLHQWYGDLVTAKWWDDQWIFDGFTIWQSHWTSAKLYPEFDYDFNYLLRLQSPMLDAHTNRSVHPIKTYQTLDANQELSLFDSNTYNKAGAVYHMLNSLDPQKFQRALSEFVSTFRYSSADAQDFMGVLAKATGWDFVEPLVRTWLDLPGVPLVSVDLLQLDDGNYLELSQERLVLGNNDKNNQVWFIPLKIFISDSSRVLYDSMLPFSEQKMRFKLPPAAAAFDASNPNHFIKLNKDFTGFYRVKYSENLLQRLGKSIIATTSSEQLTAADRFNVIDDLRGLMKLGRVEPSQVTKVLNDYYARETNGGVLSGLATVLVDVAKAQQQQQQTDGAAADMQQLAFNLFVHVFDAFGFRLVEGESHAAMNGRQDALMALVQYKHEPSIGEALQVFDTSDVHLAPFLRKPVYLAVLLYGSDEKFEHLLGRVRDTKSAYERQILVAGLAPYATSLAHRKEALASTL